ILEVDKLFFSIIEQNTKEIQHSHNHVHGIYLSIVYVVTTQLITEERRYKRSFKVNNEPGEIAIITGRKISIIDGDAI
ncbi:hypothetical protein, partial [Staphylococcus aureus]